MAHATDSGPVSEAARRSAKTRVLLVKMSSLGDVVHALPAVTDAAAAGFEFDWVVEEAFCDIPSQHPAVRQVIPFALRRWRRNLKGSGSQVSSFVRLLRQRRYEVILDAQGLLKSAIVARLARGEQRAGLSRSSAREPAAAWFYDRGIDVPKGAHAVLRLRALFAQALGYPQPYSPVDYGLATPNWQAHSPRLMLLHGTTWASKHWPEAMWIDLAQRAKDDGFEVVLAWGSDIEKQRAERIAEAAAAQVLPRLSISGLLGELKNCSLVIGVDSGLPHLAAALGLPTLGLYGSTNPQLTGALGQHAHNLKAEFACSPCLKRECVYRGEATTWNGQPINPPCFASLPPADVWRQAKRLNDASRVLHL